MCFHCTFEIHHLGQNFHHLNEMMTLLQFFGIVVIILATYVLEVNFHKYKSHSFHKIHFDKLKKLDWKTVGVVFMMLFVISICAMTDKMILMTNRSIF